jgi:hypothetical protein
MWSAGSSISFTPSSAFPDSSYEDYTLSLAVGGGEADTSVKSVTLGGMNIYLDEGNRLLRLDGVANANTNGVVTLHAKNRLPERSFDVYSASLSVQVVSSDRTGTAIGTNFAIYDSRGNRQDKATYMVPGQESRLVAPIVGPINTKSIYVVVRDPSGIGRTIPDNTYYSRSASGARGSDGYRYVDSNFEIWFTPLTTGPYAFEIYYTQVPQSTSSNLFYRQVFRVEGEVPGGKEGGCDSGAGILAVFTALPVLLRIQRKKRQ